NRGSHTFKIGGNFSRLQHNDTSPRQPAGQFSFQSLEDLLRNNVNEALISLAENFVRHTRQSIYGAYFQDDWRIHRRLTLNWGVRWEMASSPKFAADLENKMPVALEEKFFALDANGRNLYGPEDIEQRDSLFVRNPSYNNFAPRVGFAWDPLGDGRTSVRGGAGIFHEQLVYWTYRLALLHTAPLFVEGRLTNTLLTQRGITGGVDFPNAYFTQRALFVGNPRYESFQKFPNQPYVGKFSLEIQREVLPTMLVRIGYSGTRGVHLPNRQEQNGRRPTVLPDGTLYFPTTNVEQNTRLGRTRHRRTNGTSSYHSMRLEVEKRLSHGLQFQGNYTWSKNIDDGTSVTGGTDFSNDPVPRYYTFVERGLAATDVRHAFTFNAVYSLPGANRGGWRGYALSGWRLNGLVRVQSGLPIGIVTGFDRSRTIEGGNYPNLAPGASNNPTSGTSVGGTLQSASVFRFGNSNIVPAGTKLKTPELWFDPFAFTLPEAGYLGNLGRNTVTAPGSFTIDFGLAKEFSLSQMHENTRLEFRGELFNAFNHVNFNAPGPGVFVTGSASTGRPSGTAGLITSTQGSPRRIQFGLKLTF
ncbi:MAG TPA: TonB-dependent receptor, partial [Terriglobia bacterium]|nr:TonB-dependent receptor [Terriglobia bacterium]